MKLSPSKVDCFLGCKRLFKYRYLEKVYRPASKYFLIGNVCHKSLELFYSKATLENKHRWSELMGKTFEHSIKTYKALEKRKSGFIMQDDLRVMKKMLKDYLDLMLSNGAFPEIKSIEKRFEIKLDQVIIVGKADRVDKVKDGFVIVDYKTSSRPLTKKEVAASVQLPTYGLWMHQTHPEANVYGKYVYLKHLNKKQKFEITKEIMAEAVEKYTGVKFSLENGCKMIKNEKYKYCFHCEYKQHCNHDKQDDFYCEKD